MLVDGLVALQTVWLLPVLDARVETILAGGSVPNSPLHIIYIALDTAKLLALLTIGIALLSRRSDREMQVGTNAGRGRERVAGPGTSGAPL